MYFIPPVLCTFYIMCPLYAPLTFLCFLFSWLLLLFSNTLCMLRWHSSASSFHGYNLFSQNMCSWWGFLIITIFTILPFSKIPSLLAMLFRVLLFMSFSSFFPLYYTFSNVFYFNFVVSIHLYGNFSWLDILGLSFFYLFSTFLCWRGEWWLFARVFTSTLQSWRLRSSFGASASNLFYISNHFCPIYLYQGRFLVFIIFYHLLKALGSFCFMNLWWYTVQSLEQLAKEFPNS